MAAITSVLIRPFTGVWRWLRRTRWVARLVLALVALVVVPVLATVVIYLLPTKTAVALGQPLLAWLSDAPPLPGDLEPVSERSVLLAHDGSELATLFDDINRVRVERDEIADVVVEALLASEDNRFYEHPGLDHRALMRAAIANVRSGEVEQGGSTITQQLVKNVYLEPSRTVRRKLTEAWYALELEDRLSKDDILVRYLNEAYFGQGSYGIEAASQLYFNTPAKQLDAGQAATLIGIIPSPSRLNPVDDPEAAREARDRVLERMAAVDRLDDAQAESAKEADLALDVSPPPPPKEPFFVAYIRELLTNDPTFDDALGKDPVRRERLIYGGGLTVHTTLMPKLQRAAEQSITEVIGDPEGAPLATLVTVDPSTGAVRWPSAPRPSGAVTTAPTTARRRWSTRRCPAWAAVAASPEARSSHSCSQQRSNRTCHRDGSSGQVPERPSRDATTTASPTSPATTARTRASRPWKRRSASPTTSTTRSSPACSGRSGWSRPPGRQGCPAARCQSSARWRSAVAAPTRWQWPRPTRRSPTTARAVSLWR
jgi:hypothetical protein